MLAAAAARSTALAIVSVFPVPAHRACRIKDCSNNQLKGHAGSRTAATTNQKQQEPHTFDPHCFNNAMHSPTVRSTTLRTPYIDFTNPPFAMNAYAVAIPGRRKYGLQVQSIYRKASSGTRTWPAASANL
eukprot:1150553-Pelagomonas_calceolata.AAC.3